MPDFREVNLIVNFCIFALAAGSVWIAGTRIARYADEISEATGISHALLGLLLLAGVTSLPEAVVAVTSAGAGNAPLAVNNLLGGVAMQIAFLAVADFIIGPRALTSVIPDPIVMMQGALNIALLSLVIAAVLVGDMAVFGVGVWLWLVLIGALMGLGKMARSHGRVPWLVNPDVGERRERLPAGPGPKTGFRQDRDVRKHSPRTLSHLTAKSAAAAAAIFIAGYFVSRTGDAIGEQTGVGASFSGAALLALATSLPEISTVLGALRLGLYTMAISDILGTTVFNVGLLFAVDATASGGPVLNQVGPFSAFAALLCIAMTALFVAGLAERRDRTIARMGYDSLAVLVVYSGGLIILFNLR